MDTLTFYLEPVENLKRHVGNVAKFGISPVV